MISITAAVAALAVVGAAPARAADSVLVPPALTFVPDRGGSSSGSACGGTVRCVGPSGAFPTIAAAIAAAGDGDTIQVQSGTYAERITVSGKALTLLGGFASGFATRNPTANATVINGGNGGTTVTLDDAGNSIIDGFTVTGGRAPLDMDGSARGSGINVTESGAITIRNNIIEGNDDGQNFNTCNCATEGGGLAVTSNVPGSSVTVTGNIIRNNRAIRGAGVSIGIPALIEGNLFDANKAGGDHGGGLYLSGPTMTIRRNLIRNNTIGDQAGYGWGGGAIFFGPGDPTPHANFEANRWVGNNAPSIGSALFVDEDASASLTGDLFHDNVCHVGGAAIYLDGTGIPPTGSTATLENVTITNHKCAADQRGAAIFTEGGSSLDVKNSIITANGGKSQIFVCTDCAAIPAPPPSTISWSLLGSAASNVQSGPGVLTRGSAGFMSVSAMDFHLAPLSQSIDAADPTSPVGLEPQPNGGLRNIGAYGGSAEATTGPRGEPDLTPPKTKLTKKPKSTINASGSKASVKFKFKSNESGSTFACKLDKKPFKACKSPKKYRVGHGKHVFKVRATDADGNVDKTPAKFSFKVT